jgi:hypothetical protein
MTPDTHRRLVYTWYVGFALAVALTIVFLFLAEGCAIIQPIVTAPILIADKLKEHKHK